jgi:homocysteine S-methyltransferase
MRKQHQPERHRAVQPVVLDGPKGTELQRFGLSVTDPWWTTVALLTGDGRRLLRRIHHEYVSAGADVVTANTFRTNLRTLRRAGVAEDRAWALVRDAVTDARSAVGASGDRVLAASMSPVEDCYQPSLVPPAGELRHEHGWLAGQLAAEGVELVIAETMNTMREAVIVAETCVSLDLPVWVSFVCGAGGRLLSGEPIDAAARAVATAGASAVLVNCTELEHLDEALKILAAECPVPIGAFPNLEDRSGIAAWTAVDRHVPTRCTPQEFAAELARSADFFDLSIVGGCCGTTPQHVRALRERLPRQIMPKARDPWVWKHETRLE